MNNLKRRGFILACIILLGFLFRLFLSEHAFPRLVFDAKGYVDYANDLLRGNFPYDRNKNMGYSLFLAAFFWLRGESDIEFVKLIQVFLDLSAGIFIWFAARKTFSQKIADIALVFYMVNPFTSSYVGIILPETYSCFLVGLLLAVSVGTGFRRNFIVWFLIGFLPGLLLLAKPSLLFFSIGSIGMITFLCFKKDMLWKFLIVSLTGFLIASSYTLVINYKRVHRVLLTPQYSTMGGQMYAMMFYGNRYPEVEFWGVAPELSQINEEYGRISDSEIPNWNKRYFRLFFVKITREPLNFFSRYVKNIFWLWDKDHLSVYEDIWYPTDRYFLRVVNFLLLGLCIAGIVLYFKKGRRVLREPFMIITLVLAATMTLQFPLVSNESRHTIPFYPLLFFWAAYGLINLKRDKRA